MSWVDYTWTLIGGMSLALGLVQLSVWLQRQQAREHLVYAIFAISAAAGSICALKMLNAATPGEFAVALRLTHLGFGTALLILPWFVRVRFRVGSNLLLYSATALRALVIVASLLSSASINISHIQLHEVMLPGGVQVSAPVGQFSPWVIPAHLNLVLMLLYFLNSIRELRRRGNEEEYRRGRRICGSMIVYLLLSGTGTAMVSYGLVTMPLLLMPVFLLPLLVLGFELGADVLQSRLASDRLGVSESRLRESEEHWELAGQIAGIAPWSWEAASGELRLSTRAREMFGIRGEGSVRLEDWQARIHPEDAERIGQDVQLSMANESRFERDYRMVMSDGSVRWISSRGRIERDAGGKLVSMYGVSFDLTQVREADAMFRAALEAAPNAIFIIDAEGRIRLVNARACLMFGFTYAELEEMSLDALVPDWRFQPEHRQRARTIPEMERRSSRRETRAQPRGDRWLPVELELRPLEAGLLLASVIDISERLSAEYDSAQQRTELAHLSRVAVLGEMSASLAHELNQPLTAIVSNAQAALRFLDAGPEQQGELRETLQDIASSGSRAGDVIRRLRAMLKKEEVPRTALDVNQLISEVLQLYRSDLINRGVSVRFELDHDLPPILGDRVQLQQVLLNLVINACDAMASLPGERRLCICSRLLPGEDVEFAVCDVGPGIALDRLEQVFEPFVTSKPVGMGLGLSVCKTIVKSHGGRIWASNTNPGASFHVALPAVEAQRAERASAELDRS